MSERCAETKTYTALRFIRWWEVPLLRFLEWYWTKLRGLHRNHASQTRLIRKLTSKPVTIRCECVAGHDGEHATGNILWTGNRMYFYGTRAHELAFRKKAVEDLKSRRVFAEN